MKNGHKKQYYNGAIQAGRACLLLISLFWASLSVTAQLTVQQNNNTQVLAQLLAGQGVTISNYTRTCDNNGTGTFTNTNTNLGINQGIVLASGRVQNIGQAANNFASTQFSNTNDAQLSVLTVGDIYDKCVLEFDIVPQGNTLSFQYVFASEEYPEFVCSPYNDVFGFFISGPNPGGGNYTNKNIATIPNSTMPVFINSVNPGISGTYNGNTWNSNNCQALNNTSYYINNLSPVNANIVYDGMTVVLTASAQVVPCQTYHLKLAIADVGDRIYDSGVFLKAYSFTSSAVTVSAIAQLNHAGFTSAFEGCVGGSFTVNISQAQSVNDTIELQVTGTATNGVDYTTIPTQVIIPAGQTSVNVPLNPLVDGIAETTETVTIAVINPCTGLPVSSATLTIEDQLPVTFNVDDTLLCAGQQAQFTVTGGLAYNWAPGSTLSSTTVNNPTATPLNTTTYNVTVTFGSCSRVLSKTIYVSNPSVAVSVSPSALICNGDTAYLSSMVSGAASPVSYLWSNGHTGNSTTATVNGTYNLTITDAYGCAATNGAAIAISNMQATAQPTPAACHGQSSGAVTANPTGGTAPYTYQWNNGGNTATVNSLPAGNYTVTITDANTCSITASATVTQPAQAMQVTLTPQAVACFGTSTGSLQATVTGGSTPYTYSWSNGQTQANAINLPAGNYTLTVTDAATCTATVVSSVTQPAQALQVVPSTTGPLCYGATQGQVSLAVSGGTTPYNFAWSNGGTANSIQQLAAGNYTATVTDANLCSVTVSANVTQPAQLNVSGVVNVVACYGGNTGAIQTTVTGGVSPYTYNWAHGAIVANPASLAAGTYALTVTDTRNCTATASFVVTQPVAAVTASATGTPVSCYNGNNGGVSVSVSGGTTPYQYVWTNGNTGNSFTNAGAGSYGVTITDANNCTATAQVTVTQPLAPLNVTAQPTAVLCYGNSTGSIQTTVSGGTSPYTYNWGGGVTTANRANVPAGNYALTVTDARNCSATVATAVLQPTAALQLSLAKTDVACYGGNTATVNATTTGGTTPYQYAWSNGSTLQNLSNVTAATYVLTVTDNNLCSATATTTVQQPSAALTAQATTTNVSCFGQTTGSIIINAAGGTMPYTYQWNNGLTAASGNGLAAGNYSITVTDNKNCAAVVTAQLTQPAQALNVTAQPTSVLCYGNSTGSIQTTVSGGTSPYTYNWGGGVTTANRTNVPAGNYSLTVTDARNCSATVATAVLQPTAALQLSLAKTDVACYGGNTATVNATTTGGTTPYQYAWSNGSALQNLSNVTAATYVLTVTDNNLCSATASVTVQQPAYALTATLATTAVSCYAGANGTATVTANGGTNPYTYNWGNSITGATRTNLAAGTYSCTVTDANNCSTAVSATVGSPAQALAVSLQASHVACYGNSTGSIQSTVSGGTQPYNYLWAAGNTTAQLQQVTAGAYSLTVTDGNGCVASATATIQQPAAALQLTTQSDSVKCYAGSTGQVSVSVSGGTTPYQYFWNTGHTQATIQSTAAGMYAVTVTDANQCTAATAQAVEQPAAVLAATATVTNVLCYAATTGEITLHTTGGTTPYSYNWAHGSALAVVSGLSAGTYSVTVTDANLCSAVVTNAITQPQQLTAVTQATNVKCNGESNGAVQLSVTGGVTPYQYSWSNNLTQQNIQQLPMGNYGVTVTDAHQCSVTAQAQVSQPAALSSTLTVTDVKCHGQATGSIASAITGGILPYTYQWSNGSQSANLQQVPAGNYTLSVHDSNYCPASITAQVNEPTAVTVTNTVNQVLCYAQANGAIQLSVNGGVPGYTYQWNNGSTSAQLQQLQAGNYTVTVTDAHLCTVVETIPVTQPQAALAAQIHAAPVLCNGGSSGSAKVLATGGTQPYQYAWSNGVLADSIQHLTTGSYVVTITDANNCVATATTYITEPATVTATLYAIDALCHGDKTGAVTTNVSGGRVPYSYKWSNGDTTQNLATIGAGSYVITITDANNCMATAIAQVNQPSPIVVTETHTPVNCHGASTGSIQVQVSGGTPGYNFSWAGGPTTPYRTNLPAGNYHLAITDVNTCPAGIMVTIAEPPVPLSVQSTSDAVKCYGDSTGVVHVNAVGGTPPYQYQWSTGANSATAANLPSGLYAATVTDANQCTVQTSMGVSQPAPLSVQEIHTNVSCNGGQNGIIQLNANGGVAPYAYSWSNGGTTQNAMQLKAGAYTVTVKDANLCLQTLDVLIEEPQQLQVSGTVTHVLCYGRNTGGIQTYVNGGTVDYGYLWSNGATTPYINQVPANTYSLTVTDANACSATMVNTITQPSPVAVNETHFNQLCYGQQIGSIHLAPTGGVPGYTYQWSTGATTAHLTGLPVGTYQVTVTDKLLCPTTKAITITQPDSIRIITANRMPLCHNESNGSLTALATGGTPSYTYNWSTGSNTATAANLPTGTYSVSVTDANGCSAALQQVVLNQPDVLQGDASPSDVLCAGTATGSAATQVSGGTYPYTYLWSNGAATNNLADVVPGNYSVTITDANGCTTMAQALVNDVLPLVVSAAADTLPCMQATGGIILNVSNGSLPYTYQWNNGSNSTNLQGVHPGEYHVTVTDANGCVFDTAFTIVNLDMFFVDASGGGTVTLGQSVELHAVSNGSAGTGYVWSNDAVCAVCQHTTAIPVRPTLYTVTATDVNGCTAIDTVSADVIEDYTVFTPNAFTPNGDGNNDYFQFYGNAAGLQKFELLLFNRWGEKVFEANDPYFTWDGMYKGEPAPQGVYVYVMKLVFINGYADKVHKGSLTLMR